MPAMIAQADLDDFLGQFMRTHSSHASTMNNESDKDAFTLNSSLQ